MFKFKPYGPFEIPIRDGEVERSELKKFWEQIEEEHSGLPDAVGCYIFATHTRGAVRPWYVGKTERANFKKEAFQLQKLDHYRRVLKIHKRGASQLYLIPRITPRDKFRVGKSPSRSIAKLEELLIGACLTKNPKLVNKSTTKLLREIRVPGYMNETPGARTLAARRLANLLG